MCWAIGKPATWSYFPWRQNHSVVAIHEQFFFFLISYVCIRRRIIDGNFKPCVSLRGKIEEENDRFRTFVSFQCPSIYMCAIWIMYWLYINAGHKIISQSNGTLLLITIMRVGLPSLFFYFLLTPLSFIFHLNCSDLSCLVCSGVPNVKL